MLTILVTVKFGIINFAGEEIRTIEWIEPSFLVFTSQDQKRPDFAIYADKTTVGKKETTVNNITEKCQELRSTKTQLMKIKDLLRKRKTHERKGQQLSLNIQTRVNELCCSYTQTVYLSEGHWRLGLTYTMQCSSMKAKTVHKVTFKV